MHLKKTLLETSCFSECKITYKYLNTFDEKIVAAESENFFFVTRFDLFEWRNGDQSLLTISSKFCRGLGIEGVDLRDREGFWWWRARKPRLVNLSFSLKQRFRKAIRFVRIRRRYLLFSLYCWRKTNFLNLYGLDLLRTNWCRALEKQFGFGHEIYKKFQ